MFTIKTRSEFLRKRQTQFSEFYSNIKLNILNLLGISCFVCDFYRGL